MQEGLSAPQVSIVVPVYNVEGYLRRCLNSIWQQTLEAWECICVDDGSPDGCAAILDEYAAKDSRFVVIHQENSGVSVARNAGVDAARAEYIGFVDPDDWIESDTYELALKAARESGADIVQWGYIREREDGSFPSRELPSGFYDVRQNPEYYSVSLTVWNKLFKRSFILENQIAFLPGQQTAEDLCVVFLSYALAKSCFYLNASLYHYETTRESSVGHTKTDEMRLKECKEIGRTFDIAKERCADWYNGGGQGCFFAKVSLQAMGVAKLQALPLYLSGGKQASVALLS